MGKPPVPPPSRRDGDVKRVRKIVEDENAIPIVEDEEFLEEEEEIEAAEDIEEPEEEEETDLPPELAHTRRRSSRRKVKKIRKVVEPAPQKEGAETEVPGEETVSESEVEEDTEVVEEEIREIEPVAEPEIDGEEEELEVEAEVPNEENAEEEETVEEVTEPVIAEEKQAESEEVEESIEVEEKSEARSARKKPKKYRKSDSGTVEIEVEEEVVERDEPQERRQRTRRRRRPLRIVGVFLFLLAAGAASIYYLKPEWLFEPAPTGPQNCLGIKAKLRPGINLDQLSCTPNVASEGETLEKILLARQVDWKQSLQLMQALSFESIAPIEPGMEYNFLYKKGTLRDPVLFSWEPSPGKVVMLTLNGEADVFVHDRTVEEEKYRIESALIRRNFAETMFNRESGLDLTQMVYETMKWKVDLFDLKPGDRFRLIYKEQILEGGKEVMGGLQAVHFHTDNGDFFAYYFEDDIVSGFFDEDGRPVKSTFLMMPLRYGRISSPYNLVRPDPLSETGEIRPHLGTDYAAPEGTPILAVADGFVIEAAFSGGNGNYVKIEHQGDIKTQYLHMRQFAEGIEPGKFVKQGDVIGYVGMTGRTTGPHVCFRFWKHGVQVDHRREKFPSPRPLSGAVADKFFTRKDSLDNLWQEVEWTPG